MAQFNNQTPQYPLAPTTSGQDRYVDSLEAEEGIGVPVPVTPPGLETEGLPESQLSQIGTTRVMSPNDPSNLMLEANQTVLLGIQCRCQACNAMSPDPSLCARCGVYGHPICIGIEHFQG